MSKAANLPVALTIAGSDSGGGAGVQADLKTFAALGVHGTCAITCVTAQNPRRVLSVEACKPETIRKQLKAVSDELPPAAIKTGMLYSAAAARIIAGFIRKNRSIPLVVDPVMIATSGAQLLEPTARKILLRDLLPLATLVTPNLDEGSLVSGRELSSVEDMRWAAREIHGRFGCAALVKGGHLKGVREAVDIFYDGRSELLLTAPYIRGLRTHGTGCAYSAAITANLALGRDLPTSVARGKEFIANAIANGHQADGHFVLNYSSVTARDNSLP